MRRAIVGRAILGRIVVGRRKPVVVAIVSLLIVAGVANAAWASSHNKRGHAAVGGISASSSKNGAISADQSGAPASSATEGPAGEAGTATASPGESATSSQPGAASTSDPGSAEEVFFDDFTYASASDAKPDRHGWSVRTERWRTRSVRSHLVQERRDLPSRSSTRPTRSCSSPRPPRVPARARSRPR